MPDNFLLTRPDHQRSLAGGIQEETEFCDVTLACEDQQVRAHKVVLAASSPKLRSILLSNPNPHPLIYLTGVKFFTMENIIKFIYTGEVTISSDQVDTFLDVAQELQVKGLTEGGQTGTEASTTTGKDMEEIEVEDNNSNIASASYMSDQQTAEEDMNTADIAEDEEEIAGNDGEYEDGEEDRTHIKERPYSCKFCPKKFARASGLKRHEDTVHLGKRPHVCPHCHKAFGQSTNLKRHINGMHQE